MKSFSTPLLAAHALINHCVKAFHEMKETQDKSAEEAKNIDGGNEKTVINQSNDQLNLKNEKKLSDKPTPTLPTNHSDTISEANPHKAMNEGKTKSFENEHPQAFNEVSSNLRFSNGLKDEKSAQPSEAHILSQLEAAMQEMQKGFNTEQSLDDALNQMQHMGLAKSQENPAIKNNEPKQKETQLR